RPPEARRRDAGNQPGRPPRRRGRPAVQAAPGKQGDATALRLGLLRRRPVAHPRRRARHVRKTLPVPARVGAARPRRRRQAAGGQQFFEAPGLTPAPKVQISVKSIALAGSPGEPLRYTIEVKTEEKKPIYAHATCNQPWLEAGRAKINGRVAVVPLSVPSVPN